MKLEKIAKKAIDIIRSAGVEGVSTSSLSKELQVPKRRIYDVKAIMKAAGLIETRRDKTGTTIYWKDKNMTPELNVCLLYTSPSPRDKRQSRMPSSA